MPVLGFGTATLGRETSEPESLRILDAAFALGFRHFDTAEAYGGGNARLYRKNALGLDDVRETTGTMHSSELILGRWVRTRGLRGEVTLATKVSSGFRAREVKMALDRSLERLGLDRVDLCYLHSMPTGGAPLAEPLDALAQARRQGLIGSLGVSNCSLPQLMEAHGAAPVLDHCQNPFNLVLHRESLALWPYCRAHGIRFAGYSPLAAGFLTGKYGARGESVPAGARFDVIPGHQVIYFQEESYQALARLEAASVRTGLPKPLLALAWVLRHAGIATALIGATRVEHLENALRAQQLVLEDEIWRQLGVGETWS